MPETNPPGTRWLNAEERRAWLRLRSVMELLPTALDAQLGRDAGLTEYEYCVLAMLSEAPGRRMRMSRLAAGTSASLPRLSRVVRGLEERGLLIRRPASEDRRAIDAVLSESGAQLVRESAPGHVAAVRELVIDAVPPEQLPVIASACDAMLRRLDPEGRMLASASLAAGAPPDGSHPLPELATPALRALHGIGCTSLEDLQDRSRSEIAILRGIGERALEVIDESLRERGLRPLRD